MDNPNPDCRWKLWTWIGTHAPAWVKNALADSVKHAEKRGIRMGAEVASDYDYLSGHDHLVSDCILGKLNLLGKRKPRRNRTASSDAKRLREIADILEAVDNRCMAVDGPVTPTKDEIRADELRTIYRLAKRLRPFPKVARRCKCESGGAQCGRTTANKKGVCSECLRRCFSLQNCSINHSEEARSRVGDARREVH